MREMTSKFNDESVVKKRYSFIGDEEQSYMPHGVIINELPEKLNPAELESVQKDIVCTMIRRKTFDITMELHSAALY